MNHAALFLFVIGLCFSCGQKVDSYLLTVKAGTSARPVGVPVFFELSDTLTYQAIKNVETQQILPLCQNVLTPNGVYFLLDQPLAANTHRVYEFINVSTAPSTNHQHTQAVAKQNDRTVLSYQVARKRPTFETTFDYATSGFLHPVASPKGVLLTDDFPIGHTHQNGIFHAWVNTRFRGQPMDFWNRQLGSGKVESKQEQTNITYRTHVNGSTNWVDTLQHIGLLDTSEIVVLEEVRRHQFYPLVEGYVFDVQTIQTNVSTDTLFIQQYHYGGMAIRMSKAWNEKDSLHFEQPIQILTSDSNTRDSANHTRPDWVCAYGEIEGKQAGLVAMNHPDNFRSPQFIRVHPSMPYFCFTPTVDAGFTIAPSEEYQAAYRFYVFDGAVDTKRIETIWEDYTTNMSVIIESDGKR